MAERSTCSRCGGRGEVTETVYEPHSVHYGPEPRTRFRPFVWTHACFHCAGTGVALELHCPACNLLYTEHTATWVGWVDRVFNNHGDVWKCDVCHHLLRKR